MKLNYSSKKLGGYILALFLILGFTAIAGTSVQAQYRRDRDYRDDRYRNDRYRNDRYRNDRYRNDRYRNDRYRNDRYRNDRYRDDRYRSDRYNSYQVARQQGYSYGMNVGAADAQRGQSYNPQRSRYWKNATEGYSSSYGNKGQYKQVFRDAFEQGYRDGWQRFAGYGQRNNGRWNNRWPY